MTRGSLLHNSAILLVGRIGLSALRMIAALLVARFVGAESFGAYMLILAYVALFEWLVDFGQTDIVVRDIARAPEHRTRLLAALTRVKWMQGLAGASALPLLLLAMGQDRAMLLAGVAGGLAVLANAILQPGRAALRTTMQMDRDIGAEIVGTVLMLPLLACAAWAKLPLALLILIYSLARIVQAGLTIRWAGSTTRSVVSRDMLWTLMRDAAPLGVAGLLVVLYDALAPLLLAHLLDLKAVALYAAAARFIFPVLVAVQAITTAFFPVLSHAWGRDADGLARAQQAALTLSVGIATLLFAGIHGGASFLMGLLGQDFLPGAALLRLLAWVLLLRAITTAMSPLIVIAGWQGRAMILTLLSLTGQIAALFLLVPRFGVVGAAIGYLLVELLLGTFVVSWIGQRATAIQIDWRPIAGLLLIAVVAVAVVDASPLAGGFVGGMAAGSLALLLILLGGTLARFRFAPLWLELKKGRAMIAEGAS
jgi:O-antigen/teichoic acid export membrane protein